MKLPLRQLDRHLTDGLAKVYLVAGDETLLVDEALEQIRAAAKRADFTMRELHAADRSFRWAELAAGADNLSLFASRKIVEIRLGNAEARRRRQPHDRSARASATTRTRC